MQFKKLLVLAPLVASVLAAPAAVPADGTMELKPIDLSFMGEVETFDFVADPAAAAEAEAAEAEQRRQVVSGAISTVVLQLLKDLLTPLVQEGIKQAGQLVKDLINWTSAREQFTKATVSAMWEANPDVRTYPAVVCYNMDYTLANQNNKAGWAKVELKKGLLKTDYDCMYLAAPNTFTARGDGGFINFASLSDKSRCTFNSQAREIRCQ